MCSLHALLFQAFEFVPQDRRKPVKKKGGSYLEHSGSLPMCRGQGTQLRDPEKSGKEHGGHKSCLVAFSGTI